LLALHELTVKDMHIWDWLDVNETWRIWMTDCRVSLGDTLRIMRTSSRARDRTSFRLWKLTSVRTRLQSSFFSFHAAIIWRMPSYF
jgi:hypothetical protein